MNHFRLVAFCLMCAVGCHASEDGGQLATRQAPLVSAEIPLTGPFGGGIDGLGDSLTTGDGIVLVGAPIATTVATNAGSVMIWDITGAQWPTPLIASAPADGDGFGAALSYADGRVAVGVPGGGGPGRVDVFDLDSSLMASAFDGSATPPNGTATTALVGTSVAIEDPLLLAGAPGTNEVFAFDYDTLALERTLTDPASIAGDMFGAAVATNGRHIAVGAPGANSGDGIVQLFHSEFGFSITDTMQPSGAGESFGAAVAIGSDIVAVGAPTAAGGGAVYVFRHVNDGRYEEVVRLTTSGGPTFGASVAVQYNALLVGAPQAQNTFGQATGVVELFLRNRGGEDNWGREHVFESANSGPGHLFGGAVAVDAPTVLVGAVASDLAGVGRGGAHLFATDLPVPPTPEPDSATTPEDTAVTIDVLANDTFAAPADIAVDERDLDAGEGTAEVIDDQVRYTPAPDFVGIVQFPYQMVDAGGLRAEGSISVEVTAVNDPPAFVMVPDRVDAIIGDTVTFQLVATDVDSDPTISAIGPPAGASVNGAGQFTWDTTGTAPGEYTLAFEVSDGQLSDTAEVLVVLTEQPDACAMCTADQVCVADVCRQSCTTSDECDTGECFGDYCADSACDGIECAAGEVCYSGGCFAACTGDDQCSAGEGCFGGRCAGDPCDRVVCPGAEICFQGGCFGSCNENAQCDGASSCFDGRCAADACDDVQCRSDEVCVGGSCFLGCSTDEQCGSGKMCTDGACVDDPCSSISCDNGEECRDGKCFGSGGCGCATSSPGSALPALLVMLVMLLGRRRRSARAQSEAGGGAR